MARLMLAAVLSWAALLASLVPTTALYFYLDTSETKCFLEELPKDTMVVGEYRTEQYDSARDGYVENSALGIRIMVTEVSTKYVIKNQLGASSGRIVFTAPEADKYELCFSTNDTSWFSHEKARIHFDMVTGAEAEDEEKPHEKLSDMATRVRDLNNRVADIRREQIYQKERELEFRDKSEEVNYHVVWWTFLQFIVLGVTATWQVRHLKSFFVAKKLV